MQCRINEIQDVKLDFNFTPCTIQCGTSKIFIGTSIEESPLDGILLYLMNIQQCLLDYIGVTTKHGLTGQKHK
jgi:hypothetical protein